MLAMIPFTLCALAAVLSSFTTVNGVAVVQRDGTFTFLTPQPTLGQASTTSTGTGTTTTSSATSSSVTVPTSRTTSVTSSPSTTPTTSATVPVTVVTLPSTTATITKTIPITISPTATATSTPAAGTASCNGIQQWQSAFAYTAGNQVIFNNQLYTANQWTYNNAPPSHPDQWNLVGTCAQPINNKANCNGVAAWKNNVAYTAGNQVTFQGHLWSAVQWTFANAPNDASGSWKDLGACA